MLFIVAPKYPIYETIERSMKAADRKVIAVWVPQDDDRYLGLENIAWEPLMAMIGQIVSKTSIDIREE
jgi:hypothetical protein